ncbi:hypothetical protein [Novosphingobium sp. KN65.2]|uniref:hypothetical protein n=1 Tax=Novosphingobium sp. KN65.2 TaxID=1478134 RepID=UPI0006D564D1|nr:hypothetical protein [Novosphingobium sp. KN65.2]
MVQDDYVWRSASLPSDPSLTSLVLLFWTLKAEQGPEPTDRFGRQQDYGQLPDFSVCIAVQSGHSATSPTYPLVRPEGYSIRKTQLRDESVPECESFFAVQQGVKK